MESDIRTSEMYKPIEDPALLNALNELGRSVNLVSTYGSNHPAVDVASIATAMAMQELFKKRNKIIIGSFNGVMTVNEIAIETTGSLLKSLERRLVRLRIIGLKISKGITGKELSDLVSLLSCREAEAFLSGLSRAKLAHISSEDAHFKAVHEGQTVANTSDLEGAAGNGVLVLEDDSPEGEGAGTGDGESNVHVEQIVAFLKGDIDLEEGDLGDELAELASDPARLGKMIMEATSIRQSVSELSGESLGDIVLGCLRRTYKGLRNQPAFKTTEGMADLQKALLLLEESMLDRMRDLTGEPDPELDRKIVQAIQEMDESLNFEIAAMQYMEHRDAAELNLQELQSFIKSKGADTAEDLLSDSEFPQDEWHKIIVESRNSGGGEHGQIASGLNSLATVFEKLEGLMKSDSTDESRVKELLGQATENLDDTIFSTKEKLELLSQQLNEETGDGTVGGQGKNMAREDLLAALSEVAQELMQPLTAINASLEMMLQGYVGEVTTEQQDMLSLASNSGEHLTFLMNMLINIVGCPTNKGTDSRFHTTSDQVALINER